MKLSMPQEPVILYAEDDLDDFESVREALEQLSGKCRLQHARNGEEAVEYLQQNQNDPPCLIVLDLNMPVMDGKEVLYWLKENEPYHNTQVIVFTTSSREDDVKLCQKYGCTFFRKPTLYRDLLHIAQMMLSMCAKSSGV
ncbi:MAG: response regulator [Flavisolibacter sp.]